MDNQPQLNDGRIGRALEAARNFSADSINVFRELGPLEAVVVIKILKQDEKPARSRRKDAGKPRGPKVVPEKVA